MSVGNEGGEAGYTYSGRTASSAPSAAAWRMYLHAVAWFSSMARSWSTAISEARGLRHRRLTWEVGP